MNTPIVEDFAAIRARLEAIRAAERPAGTSPTGQVPAPPAATGPTDFYTWLTDGKLWNPG